MAYLFIEETARDSNEISQLRGPRLVVKRIIHVRDRGTDSVVNQNLVKLIEIDIMTIQGCQEFLFKRILIGCSIDSDLSGS